MRYDAAKLDAYMADHGLLCNGATLQIVNDGTGAGPEIITWDEAAHGPRPTPEEVTAWQPSPLPTVAAQYAGAKSYASDRLNTLMAAVALQIMGQGASESDTNAAGSAFVVQHSSLIQAWLLTGANHVAGQALLAAITADPPAWWTEPIAALFAEALA